MKRLSILVVLSGGTLLAEPLLMAQLLRAVETNYPPLLATLLEREVAAGSARQARGQFDTQLGAMIGTDQFGYYPNERVDVGVSQNLQWQGASVYSGWRI